MPDDDITACLQAHAAARPTAPVFSAPSRMPMTWGSLAQRVRDARGRLASWGIERGDVLAAAVPDRVECAATLAILPASSTLALFDPTLSVDDFVALIRRVGAKAAVVPAGGNHALREAARRLGVAEVEMAPDGSAEAGSFGLALRRPAASLDGARRLDARWAYIGATSGTTGQPKLVPHGHRQLLVTARAMGARLSMTHDDVSGHLTPLHLANGLRTALMLAVLNGGSVRCLPEADAGALLDAIDEDAITYVSASFTILREVIERVRAGRRPRRGRLRFIRAASGRLEPHEFALLERAFGVPAITGLGATETGMMLHQRLPPAQRTPGSVGDPIASEIRIVGDDGRDVAPGDVGELQVRGPQVFDGYLDAPALNTATFVDGWFRTGDLGRFDPSGDVHLVGRATEVINRGGEKLAPLQIDAVLRAIPGVSDAAAFGIPHPRLGQEVVAAIVRDPGVPLTEAEVQSSARAALGLRRAPRHVWFVDALPRNDAGKVLRAELARLWSGDAADAAVDTVEDDAPAFSPLEAALAGLWSGLLRRNDIRSCDDFGQLGGDAGLAARLVEQVREVFGVELPPGAVEEDADTLAGMAARIERARRAVGG
jgi:oxalate---CoA ligase